MTSRMKSTKTNEFTFSITPEKWELERQYENSYINNLFFSKIDNFLVQLCSANIDCATEIRL